MLQRLTLILVFISSIAYGQSYQTVRGTIKESFTERAIEGVVVKLLSENLTYKETVCDAEGNFTFTDVEIGFYDILFTHVNYKSFIQPSIAVTVSKETVLNIVMENSSKKLDEVEVNFNKERGIPNNEMANSSVFSIHPNDARRIAGGLDDPIRVTGTLPGVTAATSFSVNNVSIRGNSPRSLKYQMEGVELPNPTHFARIGGSGGTFTIFSMQLMDKSDFYTGAFSAEFGDALGGVFDVKFKKGNSKQHEMTFQIGSLGAEFGSEGPLSKKNNSSYVLNYRYATVGLGRIGNPSSPTYQDLSFNIDIPLAKSKGKLQFFALAGTSDRTRSALKDSADWAESLDRTTLYLASTTATIGGVYKKYIGAKTVFKATAVGSYSKQSDNKEYIQNDFSIINQKINEYTSLPVTGALSIKHKFGLKHSNITGLSYNTTAHDWRAEKFSFNQNKQIVLMDGSGRSNLLKAYTQSKFSITEKFNILAGAHYLNYDVTNQQTIEPRLSLNYQLNPKHSISLSSGMHSQVENYATYLYEETSSSGEIVNPNKNLGLSKAIHYIVGYRGKVFTNHRLRIEAYYQQLYDVPVDSLTFSTINLEELSDLRTLTNSGTGQNYGIDIGFERYTDNGLYYIFNSSFWRSLYTAGDGVQRSSAFDNNYNLRFIIGKEYKLRASQTKKGVDRYRAFSWNGSLNVLGGQVYTPLDFLNSKLEQETIYDESLAFTEKGETLLFLDFNFSYTINKKKRKSVWAIQVKNLLNNGNALYREYDTVLDKEVEIKSTSFFPNIYYRLEF
ncbi:MAG: TonB-dependent receptor plug domain-containing protein [Crocinitomix sp.]|nr:TonB-dependent receptor plug domain-containing protein [Crocinitomix sp.]